MGNGWLGGVTGGVQDSASKKSSERPWNSSKFDMSFDGRFARVVVVIVVSKSGMDERKSEST